MKSFNQHAQGVDAGQSSPEHTRKTIELARDALLERERTMIERQQPVPVLKPHGMGEDAVDRQIYRQQLRQDHRRAQRSQQIYGRDITPELKSTTQNFNTQSQQQEHVI